MHGAATRPDDGECGYLKRHVLPTLISHIPNILTLARIAATPVMILLLGRIPARQLLGEDRPLREIHGRLRRWKGYPVMITCHPASAMRFPEARALAERDFDRIRLILKKAGGR